MHYSLKWCSCEARLSFTKIGKMVNNKSPEHNLTWSPYCLLPRFVRWTFILSKIRTRTTTLPKEKKGKKNQGDAEKRHFIQCSWTVMILVQCFWKIMEKEGIKTCTVLFNALERWWRKRKHPGLKNSSDFADTSAIFSLQRYICSVSIFQVHHMISLSAFWCITWSIFNTIQKGLCSYWIFKIMKFAW